MIAREDASVNVVVAGAGGQGSILTSHLLAAAALRDALEVRLAETFGAATRGGSVLGHVRLGAAWSPMVPEDCADVIAALEPLEGLRAAARFLKPGGWALLNTHPWYPVDVSVGRARYPALADILAALGRLEARALAVDATALAIRAGDARAANTVILGGLMALGIVPVSEDSLFEAMEERWSGRLAQINRAAYALGHAEVESRRGETP